MLTNARLTALKADMQINQAANIQAGEHGAIAASYNADGTGTIWRPRVDVTDMNTVIDWAAYAGLTVAKQNTYLALTACGYVDATSSTVRAGFVTVFGAGSATVTALTEVARRVPTRFEQLFSTNSVSTTFGYRVTVEDVIQALGS